MDDNLFQPCNQMDGHVLFKDFKLIQRQRKMCANVLGLRATHANCESENNNYLILIKTWEFNNPVWFMRLPLLTEGC